MNIRFLVTILISLVLPLFVVSVSNFGITHGTPLFVLMEIGIIILFTLIPLVYGWYTVDTRGAVIIGILPIIFLAILAAARDPSDLFIPGRIDHVLVFLMPLILMGGLIGFCASRQNYSWLFLAVCCIIGWVLYFLVAGIN
jgi:hypothetical protein